MSTNS